MKVELIFGISYHQMSTGIQMVHFHQIHHCAECERH